MAFLLLAVLVAVNGAALKDVRPRITQIWLPRRTRRRILSSGSLLIILYHNQCSATVKRTRRRIHPSDPFFGSSATVKRTRRRTHPSDPFFGSSATVKRTRRRIQSHFMVVIMGG